MYGSGILSHKIFKDKALMYYEICLPYVNVRELVDIEAEYKARKNKNIEWEVFLNSFKYNEKRLSCYIAIAENRKIYDEMGIIISRMGNLLYEVERKNEELKKLQEQRHNLIRDFSHTYENIQAVGLKKIADTLLENIDKDVRRCGRLILAEYGIKNSMNTEFKLLKLNFEDRRDDIVKLMANSVYEEEKENTVKIKDIFEDAFKICMLRVIYSGNPKGEDIVAKKIYKRIKKKVGSMNNFVEQFEKGIVLGSDSLVDFFNGYNIPVSFCTDKEWNTFCFLKNGYAEILIRSIFCEVIVNFMKYAYFDR